MKHEKSQSQNKESKKDVNKSIPELSKLKFLVVTVPLVISDCTPQRHILPVLHLYKIKQNVMA